MGTNVNENNKNTSTRVTARVNEQVGPATAAIQGTGPTDIGQVDGTLGSCAGLRECLSSFDDRPLHFANPWEYEGSQVRVLARRV